MMKNESLESTHKRNLRAAWTSLIFLFMLCIAGIGHDAHAQSANEPEENSTATAPQNSANTVRQLASRDPLTRQHAAEELARLAATDQQKLVAGYRVQEKNARVRLALDWALYRMGKNETLFAIVRDLDSSRRNQANSYLSQLESPDPLYLFLERVNGNTLIRLLEALAPIGDDQTIERIKPYAESLDPLIANAAKITTREISLRLAQAPATTTRQRQTGNAEEATP
jgi:hypothetical protein